MVVAVVGERFRRWTNVTQEEQSQHHQERKRGRRDLSVFTNQRLAGREILVPKSVMDESVVSGLPEDSLNTVTADTSMGLGWLVGCGRDLVEWVHVCG